MLIGIGKVILIVMSFVQDLFGPDARMYPNLIVEVLILLVLCLITLLLIYLVHCVSHLMWCVDNNNNNNNNSIVILVTIHYAHRQEYVLQL
jgi:hypothetical protein